MLQRQEYVRARQEAGVRPLRCGQPLMASHSTPAPLLPPAQVEAAAGQPRGATVESLRTAAAAKRAAFELAARNAGNGAEAAIAFADNSRRAFFKEFSKVVEAADVIIEVLDARDPAGCRCLDVERFVRRVDPSKKIVILLNKIGELRGPVEQAASQSRLPLRWSWSRCCPATTDSHPPHVPLPSRASLADLVPREVVEQWLKHFREELPTVAFKCSTQKQATNLGRRELSQAADAALKGSECLGELSSLVVRRWLAARRCRGCRAWIEASRLLPPGSPAAQHAARPASNHLTPSLLPLPRARRRHAAAAAEELLAQQRAQDGHHRGRGGAAKRRQVLAH